MGKFVFLIAISLSSLLMQGCSSVDAQKEAQRKEEVKYEIEVGKVVAFQIVQAYGVWEDPLVTPYVARVGKSVALFAGRNDFEYHFAILDNDGVNAFATPGGYIFITIGALRSMQNEAQLAGVLGHEVAHVNQRHVIKNLPPPRGSKSFTDILVNFLAAQGTVVSTATSEVANRATQILFQEGLQKEAELDADARGLEYALATGYDVRGLPDFLSIIKAEKDKAGVAEVYHTHPPLSLRLAEINKKISSEKLPSSNKYLPERFKKNVLLPPPFVYEEEFDPCSGVTPC